MNSDDIIKHFTVVDIYNLLNLNFCFNNRHKEENSQNLDFNQETTLQLCVLLKISALGQNHKISKQITGNISIMCHNLLHFFMELCGLL